MKVLAAYLLLVLGGNKNPTAADIRKVLESVSVTADDERIESLLTEMKGKKVEEVIAAGEKKLVSVPTGAPSGPAPAAHAPAKEEGKKGGAPAKEAKKEEKKKEEEEKKEESDEDMGFGLFD